MVADVFQETQSPKVIVTIGNRIWTGNMSTDAENERNSRTMRYETTKIKTGTCRHCGRPYGYIKDLVTKRFVNEFSECACKNAVFENDITKMHRESVAAFTVANKATA